MDRRSFALIAGAGCAALIVVLALAAGALLFLTGQLGFNSRILTASTAPSAQEVTVEILPTLTIGPLVESPSATPQPGVSLFAKQGFNALYEQVNGGAVNIQVVVNRSGQTAIGAGSGFILDDQGHIITNNHVVSGADYVTVLFYDGTQAAAEVLGTDVDSDLAVIQVNQLASGAHPLPLGDSDQVEIGEWVIAIGNPFGQQSSMSLGIVSAVGRTIPTGVTAFRIPQAIQTDAAINPGNSGGPLINLKGEVIGVNAQIASDTAANTGVGFAIPSNIVRRVAPVLIVQGTYEWPWLGVTGQSVGLEVAKANNLANQRGAYIDFVEPNGPADRAGLHGSTGSVQVDGIDTPVGGDVVVQADGKPITSFNDLLVEVAFRRPGDRITLTILRNGVGQQVTAQLEARPSSMGQ
jgi:S1-C subfamily serine protease